MLKGFLIGFVIILLVGGSVVWWRRGETLGKTDGKVEILAVGDVMLGRSVNTGMQKRKDFLWPFRETADILRKADITFGNLENPLIKDCPETDTGMIFCGELEAVKGLTFAGFDVVSIANNHFFNYGKDGAVQTSEALREGGISLVGHGLFTSRVIAGKKFTFLGFEDVTRRLDVEYATMRVKEEVADGSLVIVSMHWGNEYIEKPSKRQREIGEALIEAGADIVIGHHPHWVQPVERYKDGVIAYSLGNFVFDQMWSEKTREGLAVRFLVPKEGLIEYELLPVKIYDYGQARWEE